MWFNKVGLFIQPKTLNKTYSMFLNWLKAIFIQSTKTFVHFLLEHIIYEVNIFLILSDNLKILLFKGIIGLYYTIIFWGKST